MAQTYCDPGPLLAQTRQALRGLDRHARKALGQHFLVDETVLRKIVDAAGLTGRDAVIEVGPGLGVLTRELAQQAGLVIAVELDDKLAGGLRQTFDSSKNVIIVNGDILKLAPAALLAEHGTARASNYKVVANLPYYITAPVLRHLLEAAVRPQLMVLTVQREVAETIAAGPRCASLLALSVRFYGAPAIVGYVPAACFYPAPKVDSAVLRIEVRTKPPLPDDEIAGFFNLARAGFAAPRKQIANSLAQGLGVARPVVTPVLDAAGIEAKRRPETLTLDEWLKLWKAYQAK